VPSQIGIAAAGQAYSGDLLGRDGSLVGPCQEGGTGFRAPDIALRGALQKGQGGRKRRGAGSAIALGWPLGGLGLGAGAMILGASAAPAAARGMGLRRSRKGGPVLPQAANQQRAGEQGAQKGPQARLRCAIIGTVSGRHNQPFPLS
jgi:hypothetical protein